MSEEVSFVAATLGMVTAVSIGIAMLFERRFATRLKVCVALVCAAALATSATWFWLWLQLGDYFETGQGVSAAHLRVESVMLTVAGITSLLALITSLLAAVTNRPVRP